MMRTSVRCSMGQEGVLAMLFMLVSGSAEGVRNFVCEA